MQASAGVLMLVLVTCTTPETPRGRADGEETEAAGDGDACRPDALVDEGDATQLALISSQNASGHWTAKVRLQHEIGDGTVSQPVHLQLQRSARHQPDGARTISLEATMSGLSKHRVEVTNVSETQHTTADSSTISCPVCLTQQPPQPRPTAVPPRDAERPTCPEPRECPSPCASCPACPSCPVPLPCPSAWSAPTTCPDPPRCPSSCPSCPTCPACPVLSLPKRIPAGYEHHPGHGYYRIHLTPVTWLEAKATCEREGAHLVVINSKEEAKIVAKFYEKYQIPNDHYGIRIGVHDLLEEGTYYTVLGQRLSESGYWEWSPNEPSDTGGNEDCGSILRSTLLNDIPCDWKGTFVCEFPQ